MDCEGLCHRKLPEDEGAGSLTWPWSELHLSLPRRSPQALEKPDHFPAGGGGMLSPHEAAGEEMSTSWCPLTQIIDGQTQSVDWPCLLGPLTLNSVSSSHAGGQRMKDFLTLPMGLAPGQRDTIATCVPFARPRDPDPHCTRGVMKWLMHGKTWHTSLCFLTTTLIFLLPPPKEDVIVLQLGVLPDPTDLGKNSIVVPTRTSVS